MFILSKIYNKYFYRAWLKKRLSKVGINFRIGYRSEITKPGYFSIGDNFFTGPGNYFSTNKHNPVFIGDHVMFGPECMIIGGNHEVNYTGGHMMFNHREDHIQSKIVIENGVWLGARSMVLSNAHIGEGAIIGANALVNNYIPPYCIAVGIPAKRIKRRFFTNEELLLVLENTKSNYSLDEVLGIYRKYQINS